MKNKIQLIVLISLLIVFEIKAQKTSVINNSNLTIQKGISIYGIDNLEITEKGVLNNSGVIEVKGDINSYTRIQELGEGEIIMSGSKNQVINGNTSITKLTVNKTKGDITLNSILILNGELKLKKGIINTYDNALLIMSATSQVEGSGKNTSGANDESFINGPMIKTGKNDFIFPIGKKTLTSPLRPIGIQKTDDAMNTFKAEYIAGNPPDLPYNTNEYWVLNQQGAKSGAYVILTIRDNIQDVSEDVVLNYENNIWQVAGKTDLNVEDNKAYLKSDIVKNFDKFTYVKSGEKLMREIHKRENKDVEFKVYPNPNTGKDINVRIKKKD